MPWQAAEGDSHGLVHKSQVALMKRGSQFDLDLDAINNMRFCNHRQMLNESFRASGIIAERGYVTCSIFLIAYL